MGFRDDGRRDIAAARKIMEVAEALRIGGLRRARLEMVGPCPRCGGHEKIDADRFQINAQKNKFFCRRGCTEHSAGGPIDLVMHVRGCSFIEALEFLAGPPREITPEEKARIDAARAQSEATEKEARAQRAREAIAKARTLWRAAKPAEGTLVRDYLARRGIDAAHLPVLPRALRFVPDLPYWWAGKGGKPKILHSGPAMLAAVQNGAGIGTAVHRSWIDLDQPKGRLKLTCPETGADLQTKKIIGIKKGGAIRLRETEGADTLIMGEGIETTLTALVADVPPGAAYWSAIDLGNMAGRALEPGVPDMRDDEAFVPPDWVRRLIYIADGDSDPVATRAQLMAGLRRAKAHRPGLIAQIVHPGEGRDLNDLILEPADD